MPRTKANPAKKGTQVLKKIKTPKKEAIATTPLEVVEAKQQVDGKDHKAPIVRARSLADLWGFRGDKFGTEDEDEYKKKLGIMNKADLQMACIKIGLMPHDSRQIMTERLVKQFRQHVAARRSPNVQPQEVPKASEASEKLRAWMGAAGGNSLR